MATALRQKPTQVAAAATASALVLAAGPVTVHLLNGAGRPAAAADRTGAHPATGMVSLLGTAGAGPLVSASPTDSAQPALATHGIPGRHARVTAKATAARQPAKPAPKPKHAAVAAAVVTGYQNPLRAVTGLLPERIDEGVDFGGTGPVYAIGDAVITNATASNYGWPGGGWITYKLTSGPDAGLMVYLAEDVTPTVQVGQHVTSSTVIANMSNNGDGIETGWAMASGLTAESQMPEAGGIGGGGPFPTTIGNSFEGLLHSLGVPAANNFGLAGSGTLPAGYPSAGT